MPEAEKVAPATDPALWDRLTDEQRAVNDHAAARVKADDLLKRTIRPHGKCLLVFQLS